MQRIKAVIFDMDGLMFDTERIAAGCWIQAGQERGVAVGEEFLAHIRGGSKEEAELRFYECYGREQDYWALRNRKTELLRNYLDTHEIPKKKGLVELLSYLKNHGIKIALATSTAEKYAFQYLDAADVRPYFDAFVCGNMVKQAKPNPEIFYTAAKETGTSPSACMVLEDSLNGIAAAIAGGFIPVMVPDITQPDEALEKKLGAKCMDLLEVMELIDRDFS